MPTSRPSSPTTPPKTATVPHNVPQQQQPNQPPRRPQSSYSSSLVRWLQLKKYQYEVTFSLYMLTPTERLIFNFIIMTLLTLLITAATMYLPNHITLIYNRIWYYVHGNSDSALDTSMLKSATSTSAAALRGAKETLRLSLTRTGAAEKVLRSAAVRAS